MVGRTVHFLSSLSRSSFLAALVGALIAAGGCARGAQPITSPRPFRDEHEADGFEFYESSVPADDADKSESDELTTETTIELDIDDDSAAAETPSDDTASDASDDDSSGDDSSGDDASGDDAFGDDSSGGDGDDASDARLPAP